MIDWVNEENKTTLLNSLKTEEKPKNIFVNVYKKYKFFLFISYYPGKTFSKVSAAYLKKFRYRKIEKCMDKDNYRHHQLPNYKTVFRTVLDTPGGLKSGTLAI